MFRRAVNELARPPMDCRSPIGVAATAAGLCKEIAADFYTAVSREPSVYRGNPFLIEAALASRAAAAPPARPRRAVREWAAPRAGAAAAIR